MGLSAIWNEPGSILLESRPKPEAGLGEILVAVGASGLCGTDIHIVDGGYPDARHGVILGHEFAGTIVEVGPGITYLAPGDQVAIDPNIPCGSCSPCHAGHPHLCERPDAMGSRRDGGLTEFMVTPATQAHRLPDGLSLVAASLAEPLACVLHAVDRVHLYPGATALVIGAGPIGLLTASVVKAAGATTVFVSEQNLRRRERIHEFGGEPLAPEAVPAGAFDVVLECTGSVIAMRAALSAVRVGGTVAWVGVAEPQAQLTLHPYDLFRRELTIVGSYTNPFTMDRALALLASGSINWEALITHRYPLHRLKEAWETHCTGMGLKVCVLPIETEGEVL